MTSYLSFSHWASVPFPSLAILASGYGKAPIWESLASTAVDTIRQLLSGAAVFCEEVLTKKCLEATSSYLVDLILNGFPQGTLLLNVVLS